MKNDLRHEMRKNISQGYSLFEIKDFIVQRLNDFEPHKEEDYNLVNHIHLRFGLDVLKKRQLKFLENIENKNTIKRDVLQSIGVVIDSYLLNSSKSYMIALYDINFIAKTKEFNTIHLSFAEKYEKKAKEIENNNDKGRFYILSAMNYQNAFDVYSMENHSFHVTKCLIYAFASFNSFDDCKHVFQKISDCQDDEELKKWKKLYKKLEIPQDMEDLKKLVKQFTETGNFEYKKLVYTKKNLKLGSVAQESYRIFKEKEQKEEEGNGN